MGEVLTWQEIKAKYPEQWVGLTNVTWEGHPPNVKTATVKYVGSSGDIQSKILAGENIHMDCTMDDYDCPLGALMLNVDELLKNDKIFSAVTQ